MLVTAHGAHFRLAHSHFASAVARPVCFRVLVLAHRTYIRFVVMAIVVVMILIHSVDYYFFYYLLIMINISWYVPDRPDPPTARRVVHR